tara:strand:+ start:46 stop:150 length:105 start_codon:yes stop_codon:yes gene_type:complete
MVLSGQAILIVASQAGIDVTAAAELRKSRPVASC